MTGSGPVFGVRPRESSNSFASGANQNCGNVLTGTPTTRVTKPPGGGSTLSLAWDIAEPPKPREFSRRATVTGASPGAACRSKADVATSKTNAACEALNFAPPSRSGARALGHASTAPIGVAAGIGPERVCRPPGGSSSLSLAWDDDHSQAAADRWQNTTPKMRRPAGEPGIKEQQCRAPSPAGYSNDCAMQQTYQFGTSEPELREYEPQRCSRFRDDPPMIEQSECNALGEAGHAQGAEQPVPPQQAPRSEARKEWNNAPAERNDAAPVMNTTPRRSKDEIEGSRPRVYKPSIRLQAPPGGGSSFNSDWSGGHISGPRGGKKLFPEAGGAGANRDAHAIEALRYYTDCSERIGKQQVPEEPHWAEKTALDAQRFHLVPEGSSSSNVGRTPGRARLSLGSGTGGSGDGSSTPRSGAAGPSSLAPPCRGGAEGAVPPSLFRSGPPGGRRSAPNYECDRDYCIQGWPEARPRCADNLPLGAEWSSWGSSLRN